MKKNHIAALICFAAAVLLYVVDSSGKGASGALFMGMVFELLGWFNVFRKEKE